MTFYRNRFTKTFVGTPFHFDGKLRSVVIPGSPIIAHSYVSDSESPSKTFISRSAEIRDESVL